MTRELLGVVADLEMPVAGGGTVRWGTQRDVVDLSGDPDGGRVAGYIAKYATKAADASSGMSIRFRTRTQIERAATDEHHRRLALAAWDLGRRHELRALRLRDHAHTLGFTGHLLTKSRRFSTTFGALRGARTAYMAQEHETVALAGTFGFIGRGYSHPRGEYVAERLHELTVEWRKEDKAKRVEAAREGSGEQSNIC